MRGGYQRVGTVRHKLCPVDGSSERTTRDGQIINQRLSIRTTGLIVTIIVFDQTEGIPIASTSRISCNDLCHDGIGTGTGGTECAPILH